MVLGATQISSNSVFVTENKSGLTYAWVEQPSRMPE